MSSPKIASRCHSFRESGRCYRHADCPLVTTLSSRKAGDGLSHGTSSQRLDHPGDTPVPGRRRYACCPEGSHRTDPGVSHCQLLQSPPWTLKARQVRPSRMPSPRRFRDLYHAGIVWLVNALESWNLSQVSGREPPALPGTGTGNIWSVGFPVL